MKLVCIQPFGHRKPGDEVEVPDGAGFDPFYFAKAVVKTPVKSTSNEEPKARESK